MVGATSFVGIYRIIVSFQGFLCGAKEISSIHYVFVSSVFWIPLIGFPSHVPFWEPPNVAIVSIEATS